MAPVTRGLDKVALQVKDISEQPALPYVMLIGGGSTVPPAAIAIDNWLVRQDTVYGSRKNIAVVAINPEMEWAVFARELFHVITREEAIRRTAKDRADSEALQEELDRETAALVKKARRVESLQLDRTLEAMESSVTDRPGTYL